VIALARGRISGHVGSLGAGDRSSGIVPGSPGVGSVRDALAERHP
jgi:hypothetical protein